MKQFNNIKNIHFVGIKGVGMAPLAIYAKEAGISVTGSDIADEFITDLPLKEAGISPTVGFDPQDLPAKLDLVIATGAHGGMTNPQVLEAKKRGITIWMQGEAVGKFMEGHFGISVTGCHGKTTTAGMLATLLVKSGLDPSYLVGSGTIKPLGAAGHQGKGKYFIAEADEYANEPAFDKTPKFLYQKPEIAIVTNIDFDHPDMFADIDAVRNSIRQFLQRQGRSQVAIVNGDDGQIQKILPLLECKVITFGTFANNDFRVSNIGHIWQKTTFFLNHRDINLGQFSIGIPGAHNVQNASAVVAAALEIGLPIETIRTNLPVFAGAKRRFELIGRLKSGAQIYDDYAHHPKEIAETLLSVKQWFPKARITVIFQPHTYSRTRALFDEFVHAFYSASEVIMIDIYPSLREEPDLTISSKMLVDYMQKIGTRAVFVPQKEDVVEYINRQSMGEGNIVITMGAGDVYKIASSLLASSV
ncbi:UDP-N-acetylmuramate--L-alanine ligase [Candidatus Microgenomates bacterium]|nr:UDP-N-acetylmuramate--L-alanine ligase [Candidatus Microgenomates bacterium]